MKSYYDLSDDEKYKLRKEFSKKYRAIKKGIFFGIVLGLFIGAFLIYYIFTKSYIGLVISVIAYLIFSTLLLIDENISYNNWLKTSKKIVK
jgi:Na+/H+-dicarboxylate symporter